MSSRPPTTKRVAGSKTHLFHSPLPITEILSNSNHLRIPAPPTYTRTKDPSTAIQLSPNTFVTILAPEVFLEPPTIRQSISNPIPLAMVDSVGESLPLRLVLPFLMIVIGSEKCKSNHLPPDLPGQGVAMMPSHLSNQDRHTPISLLQMISRLQVHRNRRHNLPIRINISITLYPLNLRNTTATETVNHTRGRTIPYNEMSPITMSPLSPTSTRYLFHLPGLRDLHPSKHSPFLVARNEEFIITRGWVPRRTSIVIGLKGIPLCIPYTTTGTETETGMHKLYPSTFPPPVRNKFLDACPPLRLRGIVGTRAQLRARMSRLNWWDQGSTLLSEGPIPQGLLLGPTEAEEVGHPDQTREGTSNAIEVWMSTWMRTTVEGMSGASNA